MVRIRCGPTDSGHQLSHRCGVYVAWGSGTEAVVVRAVSGWAGECPLVAGRPEPDADAQFSAILTGLGVEHAG